ncbi:MAG: dTMP kinase [Desulfobacteraceae bacterium 4572_123]|nr:MAG: dTMP kinase [Desulfobacteraceae bacterium 4572_123]
MFITLEGIEGAGKTTQIKEMVGFLENRGRSCTVTREPGGTAIGKKIRSILLDPECGEMHPLAELLLYNADRAQHVETLIKPALDAGKTVICDRFFDATTVYQGYARGLDIGLIMTLHQLVLGGLKPDMTILFDLPAETGLTRAWKAVRQGDRTNRETRFEEEKLEFHEQVRNGYLDMARQEPTRFRVIDARQDQKRVKEEILRILAI